MVDLALIEFSIEPYARNRAGDMGGSPHPRSLDFRSKAIRRDYARSYSALIAPFCSTLRVRHLYFVSVWQTTHVEVGLPPLLW
jgi:hypothetical protein